jgi:hypothetical protein
MAAAIGKFGHGSGKMLPNTKYFELYNVSSEAAGTEVCGFGIA